MSVRCAHGVSDGMYCEDCRFEQLQKRYIAAAHAVQTGIAAAMHRPDYHGTEPKHMRVGVDMSKSDAGGLAGLLISKGVFTRVEYIEAVTKAAETEQAMWEHMLGVKLI